MITPDYIKKLKGSGKTIRFHRYATAPRKIPVYYYEKLPKWHVVNWWALKRNGKKMHVDEDGQTYIVHIWL